MINSKGGCEVDVKAGVLCPDVSMDTQTKGNCLKEWK